MPDLSQQEKKYPPMPNLLQSNAKSIPPPPILLVKQISNKVDSVINSQTLSPKKVQILDNKKPDLLTNQLYSSSLRSSVNKAVESSYRQSDEFSVQQDRTPRKGNTQLQNESEIITQQILEIKIILKNNNQGSINKSPLASLPLFEQAKILLYEDQIKPKPQFPRNEDSLQGIIQRLHTNQLKVLNKLFEKYKEDQKKQTLNQYQTQQSITGATVNNYKGETESLSTELEDKKILFEENQELKMRNGIMQADLQFQAQKTKDLQRKYESDLDNLRNQLKGSQTDQFTKQQIENKKLMSDNSLLMKEIKFLNERLQDEQKKVIELFDDAMLVRDEIQQEIEEFETMRNKFELTKSQNKSLKAKLMILQNVEVSELDLSKISYSEKESNQEYGGLKENEQYQKHNKTKKKAKVQMVSIGISKPQSLISLTNDCSQKIEALIEEKSKSIAQVLTKAQLQSLYGNFYSHPYALQSHLGHYQYQQKPQIVGPQPYNSHLQSQQRKNEVENIVEMSLNESEDNEDQELIRVLSTEKKDLKSQISDINTLKRKVQEMKEKHDSQMLKLPLKDNSSEQYLHYQQQQQQLIQQYQTQQQMQQRSSDRFKSPNIKNTAYPQSLKQLNITMMGSISGGQNMFNYQSIGDINTIQTSDLRFGNNPQGEFSIMSKAQATPAWVQENRNINDNKNYYQQPNPIQPYNSSPGAFNKLANFRMNEQKQIIKQSSSIEDN